MLKSSQLKYSRHLALVVFFSLLFFSVYADYTQEVDSALMSEMPSKSEGLIRGERLFYGLITRENKPVNCAGCHNTRFSDTLNWNPDAIEISEKYLEKSVEDLSRVLLNPSAEKLSEVHSDFKLTQLDIVLIKGYMDELATIGLRPAKPAITFLLLFITASLLFLYSIIDLVIVKKLKKRWIHFMILFLSLTCITYILVADAIAVGHSPDYEPDQPIKFSHKVHAGQNGTNCLYCHSFAPYSKSAGIPSANVCMNCHLIVRNGTRSGSFEIAKIIKHFEDNQPIAWVKVYNLPDHVFFSHAQHVGAGAISCQKCHGEVEKKDRISLNQELTMGWCINCHRTTNVSFRENKFYTEYKELEEKIGKGMKDNVTVENIGGTECMKCHY